MEKVRFADRIANSIELGNIVLYSDGSRRLVGVLTMLGDTNTAPNLDDVLNGLVALQEGGVMGGRGREHV